MDQRSAGPDGVAGAAHGVTLDDAPRPEDVAFLEGQINAYNIARTGHDDGLELAVWLRDSDGVIAGGRP